MLPQITHLIFSRTQASSQTFSHLARDRSRVRRVTRLSGPRDTFYTGKAAPTRNPKEDVNIAGSASHLQPPKTSATQKPKAKFQKKVR